MNNTTSKSNFDAIRYYPIIVPLLMSGTFLSLLGNVYLLMCIRWIRQQALTANLRLSLSLAGSDAWAAVLLLNGWAINNVIPYMFKIQIGEWIRCYYLVLELLRLSGLITSAIHLLALALNHFFSIVSPLKYQTTVTPLFSHLTIGFLWLAPMLAMFLLASAFQGDGFRIAMCGVIFYFHFSFRLIVFLQFTIPLVIMLIIYSYILIRLSAARRQCALLQRSSNGNQRTSIKPNHMVRRLDRVRKASTDSRTSITSPQKSAGRRLSIAYIKQSIDSRPSITFSFNRLSAVKRKIKAVTTTLLILGTFVLGWLPAVFMFVSVCVDCVVNMTPGNAAYVFVGNTMVNTLIVSKLLLNPFIYAYRLAEIRYALWVMHATRLGRRPLDITRLPVKFRRMAPSVSQNPRNGLNDLPHIRRIPLLIEAGKKKSEEEERIPQETVTKKTCKECAKEVDILGDMHNGNDVSKEGWPVTRISAPTKRYSWQGYTQLPRDDRRYSLLT